MVVICLFLKRICTSSCMNTIVKSDQLHVGILVCSTIFQIMGHFFPLFENSLTTTQSERIQ
jgi:hypothetical protein